MGQPVKTLLSSLLIVGFGATISAGEVKLSGIVTQFDGKPATAARVVLVDSAGERLDSATAAKDGSFTIRCPAGGLLRVRFAAPLHGVKDVLILADREQTAEMHVQLGAPSYVDGPTPLLLSTSEPGSPLNNTPLVKQLDGTSVAEVKSNAPELLVAINGLVANAPPLALPGAPDYRCFDNLHCYGVVHTSAGEARIVFDPAKLLPLGRMASVVFKESASAVAAASAVLDRMEEYMNATRAARQQLARKLGKAMNEITKDPPPAERVRAVVAAIEHDRVPAVRNARLFEYLSLVFLGAPPDPALVRRALQDLTPASPMWPLFFGNVAGRALVETGSPEEYIQYAIEMMDAQPTKKRKAIVAAGVVGTLEGNLRADALQPLIRKVRAEVPDEPFGKALLQQFGSDPKFASGNPLPEFSAPALGEPTTRYTKDSLRGRAFLIDFWATWCVPCITELPGLTRLHEKYRGQGFEILSYSVDSELETVRRFRQERFPMPWLHAMDPNRRELQSPMAVQFEVISIPRPILVDCEGNILATGEASRGKYLEQALTRLFAARPSQ